MNKGKAFLFVGGTAWGKSLTLHALIGSRKNLVNYKIREFAFIVKVVSNGDDPTEYEKFVNEVDSPNLISAFSFCFIRKKAINRHLNMIKGLSEKYELYFWIMKKKYEEPEKEIPYKNIELLRNCGEVFVYDKTEEDYRRAEKFKEFIVSIIKGD